MNFEQFKYEYDLDHLELITPAKQNFKMWITPRFHYHYENICYEEFTSDLITSITKNIGLFIDVGAHYGYFSLLVGRVNQDCKIIAFEPVPENFEVLKRNLDLNRITNAEAINQAVSSKRSRAIFNVSTASDNSAFIQHPATPVLRQIEVQTTSLSEVLLHNKNLHTLIKVDSEGHELKVLEGIENILRERDDIQLILELNPDCCHLGGSTPEDLLNKLISLGYDCYFLNDQEHRLYRPADGGVNSWKSILGENSHINLLCKKRSVSANVLIYSHSSFLAGAERSLLELVKELTEDYGTLCTVILPTHGPLEDLLRGVGAATIIAPLIWWCSLEKISNENDLSKIYLQSFQWLYENLHQFELINPDVILTNTMVIPWGALVAHLLKRPHIWMIREFGEPDQGLQFFSPFSKVLKIITESSDIVVTNSKAVKNGLYPNVDSQQIKTIYNYLDFPEKEVDTDTSAENYFHLPDAYHLAILGTVAKSKGQEDAVRAVIELNKKRKRNAELLIVGFAQPEFQSYLQELIDAEEAQDYIHIIPFQKNASSIYRSADIILICSKMEAFGRVTLEAMLMEKAVIATNSGGTPEMIQDEKTGLLYTPGKHLQLADQIEKLLDNPEMRIKLAHNAHQFAITTFTKDKFGGEYNKIILELKNKKNQDKEDMSWFLMTQFQQLIQTLNTRVAERDQATQTLNVQIAELNRTIQSMAGQIAEQNQVIRSLTSKVTESEQVAKSMTSQVMERDTTIQKMSIHDVELEEEVLFYALSKSWRFTRPFRKIMQFVRGKKND